MVDKSSFSLALAKEFQGGTSVVPFQGSTSVVVLRPSQGDSSDVVPYSYLFLYFGSPIM